MKRKHLYRKPDPRNAGLVRVYFRHPKTGELTRLPDDETSQAFAEQYDPLLAAVIAAPRPARDPNVRVKREYGDGKVMYRPATLGWFAEKFLASKFFDPAHKDAYAEGTRYNYRKALDLLKARLGSGFLVDLDQEAVEVYSAEVAREHGDSAGDDQISMVSNLWEFAKGFKEFKRKGRINPTTRIARHYQHDGEGHLVWPEEVVERFDHDAPARLQFVRLGLHYTGQRGGDVIRMKWADFDGARIYVVQEKTGKKMWLNCPKPLLAALKREQRKTNSEFMFLNAHGNPYASAQVLSHVIRHRLESLKIEGYTTHGLRKNAGMELAEAGCTVLEVMAVLGHKTPKMAMFYCEQAQQKRMNESAVGKWDAAIEKRAVKDVEKKRAALRVVS